MKSSQRVKKKQENVIYCLRLQDKKANIKACVMLFFLFLLYSYDFFYGLFFFSDGGDISCLLILLAYNSDKIMSDLIFLKATFEKVILPHCNRILQEILL